MKYHKSYLVTAFALLLGAPLSASLVLEEYFHPDDFSGNIGANAGWDNSTNNLQFHRENLSFNNAGYRMGGNEDTGLAQTTGGFPRGSSTALDSSPSGEFWFSALHKRVTNGEGGQGEYTFFSLGEGNDINPDNGTFANSTAFGIYNDEGTLRPFIQTGRISTWDAGPESGSEVNQDETYLILARGNTSRNNLDVWFFAQRDRVPGKVEDLPEPTVSTSAANFGELSRLWFGKTGEANFSQFDAIRLTRLSNDEGLQAVTTVP
ncbi:MAG: hypothetical protein JJT75_10020 [Opitutales bacterium]|nr:hypothetical protein [Opitutales bacterium]